MNSSAQRKSTFWYLKTYFGYILPMWLFPIYFVIWGIACEIIRPRFVVLLFLLMVGVPLIGIFARARAIRSQIPYGKYFFLTMVMPFFIFGVSGVVLMILEGLFGGVEKWRALLHLRY